MRRRQPGRTDPTIVDRLPRAWAMFVLLLVSTALAHAVWLHLLGTSLLQIYVLSFDAAPAPPNGTSTPWLDHWSMPAWGLVLVPVLLAIATTVAAVVVMSCPPAPTRAGGAATRGDPERFVGLFVLTAAILAACASGFRRLAAGVLARWNTTYGHLPDSDDAAGVPIGRDLLGTALRLANVWIVGCMLAIALGLTVAVWSRRSRDRGGTVAT